MIAARRQLIIIDILLTHSFLLFRSTTQSTVCSSFSLPPPQHSRRTFSPGQLQCSPKPDAKITSSTCLTQQRAPNHRKNCRPPPLGAKPTIGANPKREAVTKQKETERGCWRLATAVTFPVAAAASAPSGAHADQDPSVPAPARSGLPKKSPNALSRFLVPPLGLPFPLLPEFPISLLSHLRFSPPYFSFYSSHTLLLMLIALSSG